MKMIKTLCAIGVVAASFSAANVMAKVSAEEAAKLGNELTPVGAEKAGNADGTIPAWTGGITEPPAGFVVGKPYLDPFASDQVLYTITKDNMVQYADKLSDGQKSMLEKYPTKGLKGADDESRKTYDAIKKLREVLKRNKEDVKFVRDDFDDNNESTRLIL